MGLVRLRITIQSWTSLFNQPEQWTGIAMEVDRLGAMGLFTRVVERRSFTQAAQDLAIP